MPDRVIMVRESVYREMLEALRWYAEQARLCRLIHSGGDAGRHALQADGGKRARAALAKPVAAATQPVAHAYVIDGGCEQIEWGTDVDLPDDSALVWLYAHPTPDDCGREGKHQWGGPERNREVCVNCGATRVLEGGDDG